MTPRTRRCIGVSVTPGHTRLTRIPSAASSAEALLVNATSLGMQGQPPLELDLGRLAPEAVVNDAIYIPLETGLLAAARQRGNRTVDGLGMLLHQAVPSFEAWFGVRPQVSAELRRHMLG